MGVSGGDEGAALAARLRRLKRDGCVLLVTGDVDARARAEATRRLLGDPLQARTRVVILTAPDAEAVETHLPAGVAPDGEAVRVVDRRDSEDLRRATGKAEARGKTETTGKTGKTETTGGRSTAGDTDSESTVRRSGTDGERTGEAGSTAPLRSLSEAVFDELAAVDHAGLTRGELRLCVDSLGSFAPFGGPGGVDMTDTTGAVDESDGVGTSEATGTIRFLRLLTATVRGVRGLGHVHCPVPDDDERVATVAPLFDARIELRRRATLGPEQRWHLPEHGATEWVRI
ncbi:hypothetical protein ACFO0N_09575 [Halobium salinum]|uniref:Uncharacterized protein n=1 Tax=Halobium salinum TaxID=1364940 RepID=A0ABD5PBE4_9EURY|nr:hypothetical protein [Halobium salinum]